MKISFEIRFLRNQSSYAQKMEQQSRKNNNKEIEEHFQVPDVSKFFKFQKSRFTSAKAAKNSGVLKTENSNRTN